MPKTYDPRRNWEFKPKTATAIAFACIALGLLMALSYPYHQPQLPGHLQPQAVGEMEQDAS